MQILRSRARCFAAAALTAFALANVASGKGYIREPGPAAGPPATEPAETIAPHDNADADLAGAGEPDAAAIGRLLGMLSGRDAEVREAAIRRLTPWPRSAAKPAVAAFAGGNLRTRLAVLDLLQEWKAPVQGIDPWQPDTIGAGQLDALGQWAAAMKGPSTQPASSDAERIAAAQIDLTALLRAADPGDAGVISSRLARVGPVLLPEVLRRLKQAVSDRDRQRLTALRYRLVASEELSLGWPGGIERLAATSPVVRHAAAEELSKRTTAADGPLLLELFSDSDPLVREISLRGLQQVGGKEGLSMLVKLLHDPSPNVRAAVLKQLAEQPDPNIMPALVEYIAQEKDADLIVHAVRVLRAWKSTQGAKCLIALLSHESWRVRAEAIDALADIRAASDSSFPNDEAATALVERLDDPDTFVASRAIVAMRPLMGLASADAMEKAVKRHPELGLEVVKALTERGGNNFAARRTLRAYCLHSLPAVRAAAVVALADIAPRNCRDEVQAALHDKVEEVRASGAAALFTVFGHELPVNGMIDKPSFLGFGGGPEQVNPVEWLEGFRSGKTRAAWYDDCLADLRAMQKSNQQPLRLAAAYPLAAMGHEDQVLPIIQAAANVDASSREAACRILPWLPWDKRLAWSKTLLAIELTDEMTGNVAAQMAVIPDLRTAQGVWALLDGSNGAGAIEQVYESLRALYHADEPGKPDNAESPETRALKDAAHSYVQKGSENQRLVALAVLLGPATTDAAEQAKKVYEDAATSEWLRVAAFQIMLRSQPATDAQRSASAVLGASGAKSVQHLALRFLALGSDSTAEVHGIRLFSTNPTNFISFNDAGEINVPDLKPPTGLTADVLLPYLKSDDHEAAGFAGYLMCLLGRKEGLAPLVNSWKELAPTPDNEATALVYRAIAALDDDGQTPVLEQIYHLYDKRTRNFEVRAFSATIRKMHGARVQKLLETIRKEDGM